jgi:hypothetical protein
MHLGDQIMFTTAQLISHPPISRMPIDDARALRLPAKTMPIVSGGMAVWCFCLLLML